MHAFGTQLNMKISPWNPIWFFAAPVEKTQTILLLQILSLWYVKTQMDSSVLVLVMHIASVYYYIGMSLCGKIE